LPAKQLKREHDFVALYGGEEFGLIMPASTYEGAIKFSEELRNRVIALRIRHEKSLTDAVLTISLGLAYIQQQANDTQDILISSADFALYQASNVGRNKAMIYSIKDNDLSKCA